MVQNWCNQHEAKRGNYIDLFLPQYITWIQIKHVDFSVHSTDKIMV